MRKLLLDANFLILPFQFNVDIFGEFDRLVGEQYQTYTLNRTYNEALNVEDGRYRTKVERLVKESMPNIEVLEVVADHGMDADDMLVQMAGEYIVCTNDSDLKRRLREQELPHIYLRQKNHLEGKYLRNSTFY